MTTPEATVRPARPGDAEALNAAVNAVSAEGAFLSRCGGFSLEQTRAFMAACHERGVQLVLEAPGGQLVGWCDILADERQEFAHGGTLAMGLLPAWRGQGWGRRLAEAALAAAKGRALERVQLEVYGDNAAAQALYERLGFEVEGVRRGARRVDGQAQDAVLMARWLADPPHNS